MTTFFFRFSVLAYFGTAPSESLVGVLLVGKMTDTICY